MSIAPLSIAETQLPEPLIPKKAQAGDKIAKLAQHTLDSQGNAVWTHKKFEWGYRNPLDTVFKRGNDYVTEQWSEEYFIACKNDVGFLKESIKNVGRCLRAKDFSSAGKHLVNFLVVLGKLAINIEVANFLKGLLGVVVSAVKAGVHSVIAVGSLVLAIGALVLCQPKLAQELFTEFLANAGFVLKDLVSIVTCLGHAIPSWLPLAVMFICPPAGIALAIVKVASNFTGIFDVMAYGGTAILLFTKAKFAERDLSLNPDNEEARKAVQAWKDLKKQLHPLKSIEGATLAMYAFHVVCEGGAAVADLVAPGAGTIAKYVAYGAQGTAAAALGTTLYLRSRKEKKKAAKMMQPAGIDPTKGSLGKGAKSISAVPPAIVQTRRRSRVEELFGSSHSMRPQENRRQVPVSALVS